MKKWTSDVMTGDINVHVLWYGTWDAATTSTVDVVLNLVKKIGPSAYWNILSTYGATGDVMLGDVVYDRYSSGRSLSNFEFGDIVLRAISSGDFSPDPDGVFVIIASSDVSADGLCSQYCAFHSHTYAVRDNQWSPIPFIFVGNPGRCPAACQPQTDASPNDNAAADAISAVVAHQLAAVVTNPLGIGWADKYGAEVSTKCQNSYGPTTTSDSTGAVSNVRLGKLNYYLQQLWVNAARGVCALANPLA